MSNKSRLDVFRHSFDLDDLDEIEQILRVLIYAFTVGTFIAIGMVGVWTQIIPILFR